LLFNKTLLLLTLTHPKHLSFFPVLQYLDNNPVVFFKH